MKFLNYGSINIDNIYILDHIVKEGETINSTSLTINSGGKGANQSVALANSGCTVYQAGKVGLDGKKVLEELKQYNVNVDFVTIDENTFTGNAIIQLSKDGKNSIILSGGANVKQSVSEAKNVLKHFSKGDYIVLQNEINITKQLIDLSYEKEMVVCLNPSPFTKDILGWDLNKVSYLFVNEVEASECANIDKNYKEILKKLTKDYPNLKIVMTVGRDGSYYGYNDIIVFEDICETNVVDTTAAGDTFLGYFLSSISCDNNVEKALKRASVASSITISSKGAMKTIARKEEVDKKLLGGK